MTNKRIVHRPISPEILAVVNQHGQKREAVLDILVDLQAKNIHLSPEVITDLARSLGLPPSDVYGVMSFYSMLSATPRPKNVLRVCDGPVCWLCGSDEIRQGIDQHMQAMSDWQVERTSSLQKMIAQEVEPDKFKVDLRIGAVSLQSGEYVIYKPGDPYVAEAILASTVMPIIWTPVDVPPAYNSMVDGGVRNASPLGDVLDADPEEIVVINCGSRVPAPEPEPPGDIIKIGGRMLAILLNELFVDDMREFLMINALVKEAEAQKVTLHHPGNGRPLKYVDLKIIEPVRDSDLGDTLDFSQAAIQQNMRVGRERAEQVLGK